MKTDVVIVEAVRTPTGRRNGGLSTMHSIDVLGAVQRELVARAGIDPRDVGQVVGGCVGQVGMQAANVTPQRVVECRLAPRSRSNHGRRAMRVVAAGRQLGRRVGRRGGGRYGDRLRR